MSLDAQGMMDARMHEGDGARRVSFSRAALLLVRCEIGKRSGRVRLRLYSQSAPELAWIG